MTKWSTKDFLSVFLAFSVTVGVTAFAQESDESTPSSTKIAVFAGGCFWCMEPPFDETPGVLETISGYTGGETINPTYAEVSGKNTGHFEALQVKYDSSEVSYEQLLDVFWHNVDPLDPSGQFCDKGLQYRSAIFVANDEEKKLAETSKEKVIEKLAEKGKVVTEILPQKEFYKAEEYHQDYYQKNKLRYKYYRHSCGRDARLEKVWGKDF